MRYTSIYWQNEFSMHEIVYSRIVVYSEALWLYRSKWKDKVVIKIFILQAALGARVDIFKRKSSKPLFYVMVLKLICFSETDNFFANLKKLEILMQDTCIILPLLFVRNFIV